MKKLLVVILLALGFVGLNSIYILTETEQAVVLQFGEPVDAVNLPGKKDAGLHFKRPFILETILKFDKRILDLNADPTEFIAADRKKLIIDAFVKYQIIDPLEFYKKVRDERGIRKVVNPIVDSRLREIVGKNNLNELLTKERLVMMKTARDNVNQDVKNFGIKVVDLRIMRADLPKENSQKIYRRMQTEREREAKQYRAEGQEEALRITSSADREKTVLLANAKKTSEITRGEGEAESTRIFAEAFGQDIEFFTFYRSMQAYVKSLKKDDTTMVLSPDSEFLRFFGQIDGK